MDEDGTRRGRARDRAVLQTLVAGAWVQIATVGAGLVSLPFVTRSLTAAEYGVLATLTGFLALLAFADLGIGSALTTRVAESLAKGEEASARSATATALVAAAAAAVVLCMLGVAAAFVLPWRSILGAEVLTSGSVTWAVVVAAGSIALSIPASLGQRTLYGLHRGAAANRWLLVATVSAAAASIAAALADAPLAVFVLASLGVPTFAGLCCTLWTFLRDHRVRPSLAAVNGDEWSRLRSASGWYFVVALAAAFGFQTDALIIAGVLGAQSAGVYGVAVRVFGLIMQAVYPALLQLWPAFADAHVRSDLSWIRSRLARATLLVAAAAGTASLVLVVVGDDLVRLWLTPELVPTTGLLLAMGAWTTFSLVQAPMFLLFNGVGRVRAHAVMAATVAVVNVPLSVWLAHAVGVSGPVLGSLIASIAVAVGPGLVVLRQVLTTRGPASGPPLEVVPPPVW